MPTAQAQDVSPPHVLLPCPVPTAKPGDPGTLTAFREQPGDERAFAKLRRAYRDAEDWRALATLLVVHAAGLDKETKAAELSVQAYELFVERVGDENEAAHALARAVSLQPQNLRALDRLRKLYAKLGAKDSLVRLLRWQIELTEDAAAKGKAHEELGKLLEQEFGAVGEAVSHYEKARQLAPGATAAGARLVQLYLNAGAWDRAYAMMEAELQTVDPSHTSRIAELHRQLAAIESQQRDNVAGAARHLQAALKAVPDDIDALQAFGVLYLSSGKTTDDGISKAADIFYKAAELARRRGMKDVALKLLRRSLGLAPDHQKASAALETTLIEAEDFLALDELYREWLHYFSGADAVPLLLRRAQLLEGKLHRREEARTLYEEASRYQSPEDESWRRLEQIYTESNDFHALASLLEAHVERMPEDVSVQTLLRTAQTYRDELGADERAAVYYYRVLEREPFNAVAFEGYKEHWRRKHNWSHLRDLILYQIEQASALEGSDSPLGRAEFAEEFVELAEICERRLGDVEGALDGWGRLAAAYPGDPRPRKNIARIEKRARMWDNMVRVQEAELERTIDPSKRLDILKRLTQVYRDRQVNPERAIELYNEILQLSPGDIQATRALTALYDRAGDYPQVVDMLRDQYERSRSTTERTALLRRMAELWHNELDAPDESIWACHEILQLAPSDKEALYRMQQILEEGDRWEELLGALERELKTAATPEAKIKILRRMARIAERELHDEDRAAAIWGQLLALQPNSLEIIDKMVGVYDRAGRYEELGTLLGKAAASSKTPPVRQVDYLLRLGQLAESSLDDHELARSAFDRVLRSRPDHRGALEALVRIHRDDTAWQPLTAILGQLQELADTEEDAFRIAWERAEILGDQLEDPKAAAEVLEGLGHDSTLGHPEIAGTLLELHDRAGEHRHIVRQAELMLLAASDPGDRQSLYQQIGDTWLHAIGDRRAALGVMRRYTDEFAGDVDGLLTQANLEQELGDHEAALKSLRRRFELAVDPDIRIAALEQMAEICDSELGDAPRALETLKRGLEVRSEDASILERISAVARKANLWPALLSIMDERVVRLEQAGDLPRLLDVCLEASEVSELRLRDAELAFRWARRGYLVVVRGNVDGSEAYVRLQALAEDHKLWEPLLEVTEQELDNRLHDTGFDAVARLVQAADVAENQLHDPPRAVRYLQRAYQMRPEDEELAKQLESTAEVNELWDPIIELNEDRLQRSDTALGRFDAYVAIAGIYERNKSDPKQAFIWLQRAWVDLRSAAPERAEETMELLLSLTERHRLWPDLAAHYLAHARDIIDDEVAGGMQAIERAAEIFDEQLGDPLGAVRVLLSGVVHDPTGARLLPNVRELCDKLDAQATEGGPKLGALVRLNVLQRLLGKAQDDEQRRSLLRERAEVRRDLLDDELGSFAEWLRIFRMETTDEDVQAELEATAERGDLWHLMLVVPAARLEKAHEPAVQAEHLHGLAGLYEQRLSRPEYALRARLEAWRRLPVQLPTPGEDLEPDQATLWRLAEETGAYQTPPVPKDPLLAPEITIPELADQARWRQVGHDPRILDEVPSPFAPKAEAAAPVAVPTRVTEDISLTDALLDDSDVATLDALGDDVQADGAQADGAQADGAPADDDDAEAVEDFEELDLEELEEFEDAETGTATPAIRPDEGDAGNTQVAAPPRPPPLPPMAPDAGLPPLPRLSGPVLPARPRVASAWEEVALAYTDLPRAGKQERVEVALVLARLWEEGAGILERAFQSLEQALLWIPEHPDALEHLIGLADRHGVPDRLAQAYERLLAEATLPEHVVALSLRLAKLHDDTRNAPEAAEERYRGVLGVIPTHVEALQRLAAIYDTQQRQEDFVDAKAKLLAIEVPGLDADARVERTLEVAGYERDRVQRPVAAIERLEILVRDFPDRLEIHQPLIELLVDQSHWQKAIDALRTAAEVTTDSETRRNFLQRVAAIYENELRLPERAIEALTKITEVEPDDDATLAKLQTLYLETARHELALPIIDRRLELAGDDRTVRASLMVAKAQALQEGLADESAAIDTLEVLSDEDPENDEVVLGLCGLYRRAGRTDEAEQRLRTQLGRVGPSEERRRLALAIGLSHVLEDAHDLPGAIAALAEAQDRMAETFPEMLRRQAEVARRADDRVLLAESLASLGEPDGMVEAADLMRAEGDGARAVSLYSRVLAEAKKEPDHPDAARRLAAALEGLVKLRIDDGDVQGAIDFMDRQLGEMEGPTIRAQLLTEMGRITFRSTKDIAAARKRFDAALREDPEFSRAKLGLGEVLIEAEQIAEAEKLLESAVDALGLTRATDDLVEGLRLLARALEIAGRGGEAYRRLTTALRHDADNYEVRAAIVRNRHGAHRWRDTVTAVEQLEQRLGEGGRMPTAPEAELLGSMFVLAAQAELQLKRPKQAIERYRRAVELFPKNTEALTALVSLCQEHGDQVEAARHASALARLTEDRIERGRGFVAAGMLFHDAAQSLADGADVAGDDSEDELRKAAFDNLRRGLELVEQSASPVLDRAQLEVAFRASAQSEPAVALRCLDRLLVQPDLDDAHRHDLMLEGVRICLDAQDFLDRAEAYITKARQLVPGSSAAVLAQARVLEATGRVDQIEPLVEQYFAGDQAQAQNGVDVETRVALLLRLAEIQESRPDKAIASLELASALDPDALSAADRKTLADMYEAAGSIGPQVLANHVQLLAVEPLNDRSLSALGNHYLQEGELDRAHAMFTVLSLAAPDSEAATWFLDNHEVVTGSSHELTLGVVLADAPADAGIGEALLQLWDGGSSILGEHLPRLDVPQDALISPVGDSLLARSWGETLKKLGQSKVALVDGDRVDTDGQPPPEAIEDARYFEIRCQHPPVILAGARAKTTQSEAELRFALARALYFTRPEAVFATGLRRRALTQLVSAALQAFHPRHSRRKHHQRGEDYVAKLSQELARKLPIRVARQLSNLFKDRQGEAFDSRVWRDFIRRSGNRVGLTLSGELPAALRVIASAEEAPTSDSLRQAVIDNAELRDLIAYATSDAFVSARREMGFGVQPRSEPS